MYHFIFTKVFWQTNLNKRFDHARQELNESFHSDHCSLTVIFEQVIGSHLAGTYASFNLTNALRQTYMYK